MDDITLTRQVEAAINEILSQFVGEMQSTQSNDRLRENVKTAITQYLEAITPKISVGPEGDVQIVCDASNNDPTTIEQGYMNVSFRPLTPVGVAFLKRLSQ